MSAKVIATIEVGGELEEAVEDPTVNRVYVNVEDKGTIAVVDTVKHAMVDHLADHGLRRTDGAGVRRQESPPAERVRRENGGDRQHVR